MFKEVYFEGWTTKRKIVPIDIPNPAKATDPEAKDLSYAFVTLMQDRDYQVAVRKPDGSFEYEADGTTIKKEFPTDALTLKFRNGSSKAIAKYKDEGVSRKLQGIGHLETFQTKETYVMVKDANGKLIKRELFYYTPDPNNPGQQVKVPIEHYVDHTVIVVDQWKFADAPKADAANTNASAVPAGVTPDMEAGLSAEGFNPAAGATDGSMTPAALQGDGLPPLTEGAPQPEF